MSTQVSFREKNHHHVVPSPNTNIKSVFWLQYSILFKQEHGESSLLPLPFRRRRRLCVYVVVCRGFMHSWFSEYIIKLSVRSPFMFSLTRLLYICANVVFDLIDSVLWKCRFELLLLLLLLKHLPVRFQLMMTPSGQQRGAGVRQTAQKPSSRAHWMIWWKSGNGKLFITVLCLKTQSAEFAKLYCIAQFNFLQFGLFLNFQSKTKDSVDQVCFWFS